MAGVRKEFGSDSKRNSSFNDLFFDIIALNNNNKKKNQNEFLIRNENRAQHK